MELVDLHGIVEGSGEELVLLHPIGLDNSFWGPMPAILAHSHRVLRLDLRGFGSSPLGPRAASIEAYAADVHRAIRRHGFARPAVLGLSFGGMVAQTLALDHPDSVSRLILCGCPGGIPEQARDALRERGLAAERDGMESIVPLTIERWFTPGFVGNPVVERVRARLRGNSVRAWSEGWQAISGFDALARLGAINVPTLVVAGEHDAATSPAASAALAAAIPGARVATLPGAPHMMQLESSGLFTETVGDFLAGRPLGVG
ncbi:alpha/beta fold hydrolase [Starkeya koreensis]|uniref:Alpha/beta fold hydrolase n=1 Tax=Ancylobacter koreensis TaxID=266121 RepID=A0ABT0DS44_9HYPH|nr:alpha/beta fold hydrolase [Ancylobacter koreensis]MCK0209942.1 alpha/beta fold hydrolase [Ancylobacter koreensis]